MNRWSYFQDLLSSLFELRTPAGAKPDKRDLMVLVDALLSDTGEVSGLQTGGALLEKFAAADDEHKRSFFMALANQYDIDTARLVEYAQTYAGEPTPGNLTRLQEVSEPRRQELLRRLNGVPGGTEKLVRMREELLRHLKSDQALGRLDVDFEHLFSSWFNRGFLVLRPIDWRTPAHILEKIIKYEAVHAINDWEDLRRRLQPPDRRCYAYFHPAMPDEPLIFVEVALTREVPGSIQAVLAESREPLRPDEAQCAVFYSISNCQTGLRGVSFGNFLIKQVATDLAAQLPNIKSFVTLSPVPGFMAWLAREAAASPDSELAALHARASELTPDTLNLASPELIAGMKSLAARYFLEETRPGKRGGPLDPVARFHLGNGASLKTIHWLGDRSRNGLDQSAGMMVNYLYDLKTVDTNHEAYSRNGVVIASREVHALLDPKLSAQPTRRHSNGQSPL